MEKSGFVLFILFFIVFLLPTGHVDAQRFQGGVVFGGNAAQLDGDKFAGYDKLGLNAGMRVNTLLSEKMNIGLEILYSQQGSASKRDKTGTFPRQYIKLNYLEVPVMLNYRDWLTEDNYYKMMFSGGLSYAYLMNASINNFVYEFQVDNFEKHNFNFLVGATFFLSEHFAFSARYTRGFGFAFNNKYQPGLFSLRSYYLTFRAEYYF